MTKRDKYVVRNADGRFFMFSDRKNYDGPQFSRDWKNAKQMTAQGAGGCIAMLANPVYHGEVFEKVLVKDLEEADRLREAKPAPMPGTTWRHHNGTEYGVLMLTNEQSTKPEYPPTVVYVNPANSTWWSRPVADWHRSMTEVEDDG